MWSRLSPTQATLCALQRSFPLHVFLQTSSIHHYWCSRIACYAKIDVSIAILMKHLSSSRQILVMRLMHAVTIQARSQDQECELTFYHDVQHFSSGGLSRLVTKSLNRALSNLESASYPWLEIPQNLPRQSNSNTSPATLYLFGATHTIVLDGTPDGKLCRHTTLFCGLPFAAWFAIQSRETLRGLKPSLDRLKDM